jgi:hypothetical protein
MPWRPITATLDEAGFTPSEQIVLRSIQNSNTGLATCATNAVRMFVGGMSAAGYPVNQDGTVPDQLRPHIINYYVWDWLRKFPQLKSMQTDMRKQAYADAQRIYEKIVNREYGALESPFGTDTTTGNWNSEQKLIMRTHPVPSPQQQFQQSILGSPMYANPNAPSDAVPTNSPGVPEPPVGVQAFVGTARVMVCWDPSVGAASYNVYRGLTSGAEDPNPIANVVGTNYVDLAVTSNQAYYYQVATVIAGLISQRSGEVVGTPL